MMKSKVVRIICHILRVRLVGLHYILTRRTKISLCFAAVTIGSISVGDQWARSYNISHKLLRPTQVLEKFREILEWSTLQK